ncbi:MAG TPA: DUF4396 domain-containing protein [Polyangiaceae bacterium]|jgi:hypothetical protein|nr:DUF4396 domain-containing protein [Polyangiaceae bacterium]
MHEWLTGLSWTAVGLGVASCLVVLRDLATGGAQHMWIMNVVWPVTALWSGPFGAWAYFRFGTRTSKRCLLQQEHQGEGGSRTRRQPFPVVVATGTSHCGSGCALGDIIAALLFLAVPFSLFGRRLFGAWVYDFIAAFLLGIAFQYFTIKPMRRISSREALWDALKADTLSLGAWQVGMYGWMAVVTFVFFHHELSPSSIDFWFMMQLGMFVGFLTAYPVNWWLLKSGVKAAM